MSGGKGEPAASRRAIRAVATPLASSRPLSGSRPGSRGACLGSTSASARRSSPGQQTRDGSATAGPRSRASRTAGWIGAPTQDTPRTRRPGT
eukprot:3436254-Prymnesium_polylepis.1